MSDACADFNIETKDIYIDLEILTETDINIDLFNENINVNLEIKELSVT